jgi:hypothetical protein
MKFRGKILCNVCGEQLNESKEPVLEREKAWCERQAIYMCNPNCEHARLEIIKKGMCFSITVEWEPWEEEAA